MPTFTGTEDNDTLVGTADADILTGLAGNDVLDGAESADSMDGGLGDDLFIVDNAGDLVIEQTGQGLDTIRSSISYRLSANVENLVLINGAIAGTGNSLNNHITGNQLDNIIKGGTGSDIFVGGAGSDTYYVSGVTVETGDGGYAFSQIDQIVELENEGVDSVISNISYTLGANVENLRLLGDLNLSGFGNAGNNRIIGNEGDNFLRGDDGNDWLDGGLGDDFLIGGNGDDTYVIDSQFDTIAPESPDLLGGVDTVRSSISYGLDYSLEHLVLTGGASIGTGNHRDNNITGNAEGNWLLGMGGNDRLDGGAGDDDLEGGFGDDYLFGRDGNDQLEGGPGHDRMYGGLGDDTYHVNDATDYAYENAGEGHDRVVSTITLQLRANIEQLELGGSGDLRGYGNDGDNLIIGNSGNNLIYGRDGADRLEGNAGNDILYGELDSDQLRGGTGQDRYYGGTGSDDFIFADGDFAGMTSGTADRIHDFSQGQGDRIDLTGVDANSAVANDQQFEFIGNGAFTGAAGQLRYQQISGNTYVQGDTDGDGDADFWIRLDGLHNLQIGDFVI